jgi:hypothetical protein
MSVLTEAKAVTEVPTTLKPRITIVEINPGDPETPGSVDLFVQGEGIAWDPVNQRLTLEPLKKEAPVSYEIPITIGPDLSAWQFFNPAALLAITGQPNAGALYSADAAGISITLGLLDDLKPGEEVSLELSFQFLNVQTGDKVRIDPSLILKPPTEP